MSKRHTLFAILLAASSTAGAQQYHHATVESSVPEYERVYSPRQQCYSEYQPAAGRDSRHDYVGPIIGGLAGGIIGAQVGRGNGNTAATAVGAIVGAMIGDRIQDGSYYEDAGQREVQRCHVIDHWENRLRGYRVTYEYAGRRYTTLLPEDPGYRLSIQVGVEPLANSTLIRRGW